MSKFNRLDLPWYHEDAIRQVDFLLDNPEFQQPDIVDPYHQVTWLNRKQVFYRVVVQDQNDEETVKITILSLKGNEFEVCGRTWVDAIFNLSRVFSTQSQPGKLSDAVIENCQRVPNIDRTPPTPAKIRRSRNIDWEKDSRSYHPSKIAASN